jgi:ABC-2 type transport system permease protein
VVTGAWCLPLALQTYLLGLAIGTALRLPGWSAATAGRGLGVLLACAAMVVLLVAPFALAASVGRGISPRSGSCSAPYSSPRSSRRSATASTSRGLPAILSGVAGPDQPAPSPVGYLLVIAVGAAGAAAMAAWWRGADQTT